MELFHLENSFRMYFEEEEVVATVDAARGMEKLRWRSFWTRYINMDLVRTRKSIRNEYKAAYPRF